MEKIITLFQRNYETDRLVRDEVVPGAEWVLRGEGVATRKYDGTCCLVRSGILHKRYELKNGKKPPPLFQPAQDPDPVTGDCPGWVPVGEGPDDRWHREAWAGFFSIKPPDGTYELLGPKVQGNPEGVSHHYLMSHERAEILDDCPRTFAGIRDWFHGKDIEGLVWHHPDGRMVKIKKKDFGMKRDA